MVRYAAIEPAHQVLLGPRCWCRLGDVPSGLLQPFCAVSCPLWPPQRVGRESTHVGHCSSPKLYVWRKPSRYETPSARACLGCHRSSRYVLEVAWISFVSSDTTCRLTSPPARGSLGPYACLGFKVCIFGVWCYTQ